MNFTQFEKSPVEYFKTAKRKKSNKNEIVELSKDFKNLLLLVNHIYMSTYTMNLILIILSL